MKVLREATGCKQKKKGKRPEATKISNPKTKEKTP